MLTKREVLRILILGFSPLLIGGIIYIGYRPKTILLFDWIEAIGARNIINNVRNLLLNYDLFDWIKFNLPDYLWVFGFTSGMLILWSEKKSRIKSLYILLPVFMGISSEFLQYFIHSLGTYDVYDVLFYLSGAISSIIISRIINSINNEKQTNTPI
jgi:VanZ family protein